MGSVAFSPDGRWLATESTDQLYASLWDASTGELKRTFQRGTERSRDRGFAVAISPDGRLLASAASNGLNVWHLGSEKLAFLKSDIRGSSVAFSPGGILVATAGRDVNVFDAFTGKELAKLGAQFAHNGSRGIAFSPDGRLLGVAPSKHVQLWDVANRRELPSLEGHHDIITAVAFTPDGKALVSASKDCTALIWDLSSVLPPAKDADAKVQWSDLHDEDRLRAYAAFCRLRASPDHALTVLKTNLKPVPAAPAERLADLIKKLDNDSFKVREQATRDLKDLGLAAEKFLCEAAKNNPSPEAAKRINRLLADLDTSADWQKTLTALKLVEELPPTMVRELLQSLSEHDPESRLAKEAKVVLQRVLRRGNDQKP
jgi:hypothetical protein